MGSVIGAAAFIAISVGIVAAVIHMRKKRAAGQGKFGNRILSFQLRFVIFHIFVFQFIK